MKGDEYVGFLFEARDEDNLAYGTFSPVENMSKTLACTHDSSAITHTNMAFKTERELNFVWTPPVDLDIEVIIK